MTKSKAAHAEKNRQRQEAFRQRNKAKGLERFTEWVRPEIRAEIKAFIDARMKLWENTNGPRRD